MCAENNLPLERRITARLMRTYGSERGRVAPYALWTCGLLSDISRMCCDVSSNQVCEGVRLHTASDSRWQTGSKKKRKKKQYIHFDYFYGIWGAFPVRLRGFGTVPLWNHQANKGSRTDILSPLRPPYLEFTFLQAWSTVNSGVTSNTGLPGEAQTFSPHVWHVNMFHLTQSKMVLHELQPVEAAPAHCWALSHISLFFFNLLSRFHSDVIAPKCAPGKMQLLSLFLVDTVCILGVVFSSCSYLAFFLICWFLFCIISTLLPPLWL